MRAESAYIVGSELAALARIRRSSDAHRRSEEVPGKPGVPADRTRCKPQGRHRGADWSRLVNRWRRRPLPPGRETHPV